MVKHRAKLQEKVQTLFVAIIEDEKQAESTNGDLGVLHLKLYTWLMVVTIVRYIL